MRKFLPKLSLHMRGDFVLELFIVIGVVLVWRGIWNLMDVYLFPGRPLISNLVSILFGLIILYLPDQDLKELY